MMYYYLNGHFHGQSVKHLLSLRSCFLEVKTQRDENNLFLKVCQTYYMWITQNATFCYTNAHHTVIQNKSNQRNVGAHSCIIYIYRSKRSVRKLLAGVVYNVRFLVYKTRIQWRIFYDLLSYFIVSIPAY